MLNHEALRTASESMRLESLLVLQADFYKEVGLSPVVNAQGLIYLPGMGISFPVVGGAAHLQVDGRTTYSRQTVKDFVSMLDWLNRDAAGIDTN